MDKTKVEILSSCSGHGFSYIRGQIVEIPKEWTKSWEKHGLCRVLPVEPEPPVSDPETKPKGDEPQNDQEPEPKKSTGKKK